MLNLKEYCQASDLSVLVLNTALALVVNERAASRASASLATEEPRVAPCARASNMVITSASGTASEEQEDGSQEHGGPGTPGEAECVLADVGRETGIAEAVASFHEDGGHERSCQSEPEEGKGESHAREPRCKTATRSKQCGEECEDREGETDQVENPAEAPHVVVVFAGGTFAGRANESFWSTCTSSNPCVSKWQIRNRLATILVACTANVEVCPLRNGPSGTGNCRCIGLQEICLVERCGIRDTAENDEELKNDCACDQDQGHYAHATAKTFERHCKLIIDY